MNQIVPVNVTRRLPRPVRHQIISQSLVKPTTIQKASQSAVRKTKAVARSSADGLVKMLEMWD